MKRKKSYAVRLTEKLQSMLGKPKQGMRRRISEGKEEILKDLYYGFTEALIWAGLDLNSFEEESGDEKTFEEEGYSIHDISLDSKEQIRTACIAFYTAIMEDNLLPDDSNIDWVQMGHWFYLAGQGHGSNFIDPVGTRNAPYGKETAIKLNDLAEKFGQVNESWAENNEVYVSMR